MESIPRCYKQDERMLHRDYDSKGSVEKKSGRGSQGVGAKTNWFPVNRQS
jgi:hypothetical protein